MSSKVNVYDGDRNYRNIVARVEYNNNLDYWDGHNWCNGRVGRHKGITKLRDGNYVLIHGSQWQGSHDYAEIIPAKRALHEILSSGNSDLLDKEKFKALRELMEETFEPEVDEAE